MNGFDIDAYEGQIAARMKLHNDRETEKAREAGAVQADIAEQNRAFVHSLVLRSPGDVE